MTTHLGIELSPGACRIVEIDAGSPWPSRRGATRVRSFAVLPPSGAETDARLASLRGKPAAVIVWSAPSEHRQVVVTGASYETMRAEALASLAASGLQTRGVLADISPAGDRPKRGMRQPVVVTFASSSDVATALQPLRNAGIRVRAVTTPAGALGSLARLRRSIAVPGTIEAYVALEESITCVALVRDAILVAARELPWGYVETAGGATPVRPREEIARRLGDDIAEFVVAIGGEPRDIGQVCVAGGLPELRSMTAPLMERLDVEVEPLDSLFAIDAAHLPAPADEFRDRGAELRLAWAAAADWPPAINLLRARRRQESRTTLSRAAVAAGILAGLAGGWRVTQSAWWQSTAPAVATRRPANTTPASATASARGRGTAATPSRPPAAAPPQVAANRPQGAPPSAMLPSAPTAPARAAANNPSSPQSQPSATPPKPAVVAPQPASATIAKNSPIITPPTPTASAPPAASPRPSTAQLQPSMAPPQRSAATTPAPAATPITPAIVPPPSTLRQDAPRSAAASPPARSSAPPQSTRAEAAPQALQPRPQTPRVQAGAPAARTAPSAVRAESPAMRTAPPPATRSEPSARPIAPATAPPPRPAPPPTRQEPVTNASARQLQTPPLRSEPAPAAAAAIAPPPSRSAARASSARQRSDAVEQPLAFDAALGTILYSPDRKLAIVDGRIVGVGDEVRGARIVDITPTAVMLRDAQGRLRRLALGSSLR